MNESREQLDASPYIYFRYNIAFADGSKKSFTVKLDADTLDIVLPEETDPPEWTELEFHQCSNCPLDRDKYRHCPVAASLAELISFLQQLVSYEEVRVRVDCRERTYSADTTLQQVAGSLMGIYMVTSGCPILNKMRPMVETHLPFSTWQDTVYRAVSMYVFSQYFLYKAGKEHNWELSGLVEFYDQVQIVNTGFAQRLRAALTSQGDASLNAISLLSSLATMATISIEDDDLDHWEKIFIAHWG